MRYVEGDGNFLIGLGRTCLDYGPFVMICGMAFDGHKPLWLVMGWSTATEVESGVLGLGMESKNHGSSYERYQYLLLPPGRDCLKS